MTDGEIVSLFLARSEQAITEAERRFGQMVRRIARGLLGNDADAEEIADDVWLKAWSSIPPAHPDPLGGFMARWARQLSINRLEERQAQKRGGGQTLLALDELEECLPDPAGGIADEAALTDALNRFLRSLTEEQRRVFIRRYWYASPIAEIARDMNITEAKTATMLLRLRGRLRETLKKEGFTL